MENQMNQMGYQQKHLKQMTQQQQRYCIPFFKRYVLLKIDQIPFYMKTCRAI
jgi:hypothetical protein